MESEKRKRKRKGKGKGKGGEERESDVKRKKNEWRLLFESEMEKVLHPSSIEFESLKGSHCILEASEDALAESIKASFGSSWKDVLCQSHLLEGKLNPGSPALLILTSSAFRSIHLLRGFRSMTKHCHAVKLFSKHIKLQEQICLLKKRVNIASGTPSRIKKLIEAEALDISRLEVVVLDMQEDVKGYSLLTLPQVRDEFWDLFKTYFYQPLIQAHLRISLCG